MSYDDETNIVLQIVDRIRPLLAGHPPDIQSAVLADLLAMWLAGHQGPDGIIDKAREDLLAAHIELVRNLIPVNEAAMNRRG